MENQNTFPLGRFIHGRFFRDIFSTERDQRNNKKYKEKRNLFAGKLQSYLNTFQGFKEICNAMFMGSFYLTP